MRLIRPYSDVLGIIGVLLAILGLALTIALTIGSADLRIYGEVLGATLIVAVWPSIRYLGAISTIMRAAASTEEGTHRLFDDMRAGMGNSRAYGQLCEVYKPLVDEANRNLEYWSRPCRLEFVEIPRKTPSTRPASMLPSFFGHQVSPAPTVSWETLGKIRPTRGAANAEPRIASD
jgi:hypothetical protein